MPKNAIIVGMPRSGTSLAAAIFAKKGYHVGDISVAYKRDGDDHNPFGYFEADDIAECNIAIFHQTGHPVDDIWCENPIPLELLPRISAMTPEESHRQVVGRYEQHAPWLWKDPRLCYTLPYWWKLVDHAQTAVLFVRRSPIEIYRSFLRYAWSDWAGEDKRDRMLELIHRHMTAPLQRMQAMGIPHLVIDYSDYQRAPDRVARRMGRFFGLELSVEDLNFRPDLNHSSLRGRIATHLRNQLRRLPRRSVRKLERLVPRRLMALVFPERKYNDDHAAKSRENGR